MDGCVRVLVADGSGGFLGCLATFGLDTPRAGGSGGSAGDAPATFGFGLGSGCGDGTAAPVLDSSNNAAGSGRSDAILLLTLGLDSCSGRGVGRGDHSCLATLGLDCRGGRGDHCCLVALGLDSSGSCVIILLSIITLLLPSFPRTEILSHCPCKESTTNVNSS